MILPQDLTNPNVDELSVMTYVSFFRDAKRKGLAEKAAEKPQEEVAVVPEKPALPTEKPWNRQPTWRNYTVTLITRSAWHT